jgi:hypothetical protein
MDDLWVYDHSICGVLRADHERKMLRLIVALTIVQGPGAGAGSVDREGRGPAPASTAAGSTGEATCLLRNRNFEGGGPSDAVPPGNCVRVLSSPEGRAGVGGLADGGISAVGAGLAQGLGRGGIFPMYAH